MTLPVYLIVRLRGAEVLGRRESSRPLSPVPPAFAYLFHEGEGDVAQRCAERWHGNVERLVQR